MKKELILFLSCAFVFTTIISVVNAKDTNKVQKNINQMTIPFDNDPFVQSDDNLFNQINNMQHVMNRLIEQQFRQINNNQLNLMNSKNLLSSSLEIQMEERNNELIYKIKKPEDNDSKVDISFKNGVLIINTHLIQKNTHSENGNKSYSYSQSNYNQSFKLPEGYDPNSINIKSKETNLIVTFKKQNASNSLRI